MPVPEQEQATEALEQRTWTSDPNLAELKNVAGSVARAEWQKRGYFKAQVTNVTAELLTSAPSELTAAVTFYIEEGPLYRLADISFRNVTVFPQEQLRALFPMQPSDVFNTEKVRIGLDGLRKVYGTRGYINFTSVPDTEIDEINHRISLVIDVDQGKQFRLIQPSIVGLDQALADTLLQKWPIKGGEVYNTSLVEQFFRQNASLLPVGANPENNIVRKIDEHQGTVGLILDFRPCQ